MNIIAKIAAFLLAILLFTLGSGACAASASLGQLTAARIHGCTPCVAASQFSGDSSP